MSVRREIRNMRQYSHDYPGPEDSASASQTVDHRPPSCPPRRSQQAVNQQQGKISEDSFPNRRARLPKRRVLRLYALPSVNCRKGEADNKE